MGSSSFNPFMGKWMKKRYPDSCKDLCTAFIERGYSLARDGGYAAMVTMQSWMFLGSFEKMRKRVIDEKTIVAMAHLGPRAFDAIGGEVVSVTADVLYNGRAAIKGAYVRLVDIIGSEPKRLKLLEAIQNPGCGYFYRADATTFHDIPGSPIAYWASGNFISMLSTSKTIADYSTVVTGLTTGDNPHFLRAWWEVSHNKTSLGELCNPTKKWIPCLKGGQFRKWYGNNALVINWDNNGEELKAFPGACIGDTSRYFLRCITWGKISSGSLSMRFTPDGYIPTNVGRVCYAHDINSLGILLAVANSALANEYLKLVAPTLTFTSSDIEGIPIPDVSSISDSAPLLTKQCVALSMADWDSLETSWDFKRCQLV